jgi:adenosylcobinamide kinase/adenosylcobinamide-phosphate guanylyltransferase
MILVIGAIASGKIEYVRSLGYSDCDIANAVLDERPVLNNLQDMVFSDPTGSDALYEALVQKNVVICNEVGSGIIPAERAEREAREATGRLCNRLAQAAERVVRLVCGIPVVIKG